MIIPSFLALGISPPDSLHYSAIGCVEDTVAGKWGYRCTGMSFLNFGKVLMKSSPLGPNTPVSATSLMNQA